MVALLRVALALVVTVTLVAGPTVSPAGAYQQNGDCRDREYYTACEPEPTGGMMMWDVLVLRPVGIAGTALGSVAWLVSYPFAALGGNTGESTQKLVSEPFNWTFNRPLGYY
jgi:hypothetical protein